MGRAVRVFEKLRLVKHRTGWNIKFRAEHLGIHHVDLITFDKFGAHNQKV